MTNPNLTWLEKLVAAAVKHEHIHGRALHPGEHRPAVCESCDAELRLEGMGLSRVLVEGRPTYPAAEALISAGKALEEAWLDTHMREAHEESGRVDEILACANARCCYRQAALAQIAKLKEA